MDRNGRLVALDEKRFRSGPIPAISISRVMSQRRSAPQEMSPSAWPSPWRLRGNAAESDGERRSGIKLSEGLDPETAASIRSMGISGLDLEPYPQRVYPQGTLFANVVGFLNTERVPQAGLEQSRHRDLQRHEQARSLRRGADGAAARCP